MPLMETISSCKKMDSVALRNMITAAFFESESAKVTSADPGKKDKTLRRGMTNSPALNNYMFNYGVQFTIKELIPALLSQLIIEEKEHGLSDEEIAEFYFSNPNKVLARIKRVLDEVGIDSRLEQFHVEGSKTDIPLLVVKFGDTQMCYDLFSNEAFLLKDLKPNTFTTAYLDGIREEKAKLLVTRKVESYALSHVTRVDEAARKGAEIGSKQIEALLDAEEELRMVEETYTTNPSLEAAKALDKAVEKAIYTAIDLVYCYEGCRNPLNGELARRGVQFKYIAYNCGFLADFLSSMLNLCGVESEVKIYETPTPVAPRHFMLSYKSRESGELLSYDILSRDRGPVLDRKIDEYFAECFGQRVKDELERMANSNPLFRNYYANSARACRMIIGLPDIKREDSKSLELTSKRKK